MRLWLGLLILALSVALGVHLRVHGAFRTGLFDAGAEGLLRADPGTLWYLLQRVIEGGGWPDAAFAADPRVEHPALVDCWATFTIGHEFLLAALHRALPGVPLHRLCVITLAACMSLCAVGVFGLARELTGRVAPAAVAAVLFCLTPAAYRTIGFVLMNEDASLPLFAVHLWLVARTLRVATPAAALAAALFAVLAAATWHATTFLLAIELGCALLWCAWSGRALLPRGAAVAWLLTLSLGSLAVPVLRAKGFAFGLPMQLALAAAIITVVAARWPTMPRAVRVAAAVLIASAGAGLGAGINSLCDLHGSDFAHVFELLWAKVRHLGELPADPSTLSFDARIMWQGPFATLPPARLASLLGVAVLPALATLVRAGRLWGRTRADHPAAPLLAPLLLVALGLAWLIERLQVLPALIVPVAAAWLLAGLPTEIGPTKMGPAKIARVGVVLLLGLQGLIMGQFFATLHLSWHDRVHRQETQAAINAVRAMTPPDAAIAADPVLGGAILAHTGRRIAVQAKWETAASRARVRALVTPFHLGTVADMHHALRHDLRCDYFLVERAKLWGDMREMSGIPRSQELPAPGTAAAAFCSDDLNELSRIPGFRLLYRSPTSIRYDSGRPSENVRLFEVLR